MSVLNKRINFEIKRLQREPISGVEAIPNPDNMRYFQVTLDGPTATPYEGGKFRLELFCVDGYPSKPPKVRFLTKIYHPNIDKLGRICLDTLKDKWTPAIHIRNLLVTIQGLLSDPNPDDPLANDVADHWKKDEKGAMAEAKLWTEKHANDQGNAEIDAALKASISSSEDSDSESDSEEAPPRRRRSYDEEDESENYTDSEEDY
jgi:ubiquitin-conjugating enzyme E2 N